MNTNTNNPQILKGGKERSEIIFSQSDNARAANIFHEGFNFYSNGELLPRFSDAEITMFSSEESVARIWNHPVEDEAWRNL